jgi:hydrogenase nickel incorporation protein HypA/HybF
MHELGIALEIVDIVTEQARGARVRRVVLEIGTLTAVLPDAIRFCFDACSADTVAEGAELETVEVPGRARCRACGGQVVLEAPYGCCRCGSFDLEWVSGMELTIRELELA